MTTVNNYYISNASWMFPYPHGQDYGNDWDRAVYFTGDMACYKATGNQKYLDYAMNWAKKYNWQTYDTSSWPRTFGDTDEYTCGQTYLELNDISPSADKISGIIKHVDSLIQPGKMNQWLYVDNLYMGAPVLAKLASVTGDTKYSDALYALYTDVKVTRKLYDTTEHLWYRDGNYLPPNPKAPVANGKQCFWSRGNGWAIAAHARIISALPKDDPHRQEYIETFKETAAALAKCQPSDGIWRASLYDPQQYPKFESSGTLLDTYAIAWGINNGYLDKKTYYPVVAKAWNAIVKNCIGSDGFVGYVQVQADDPSMGQSKLSFNSTEEYGFGAVLLAGSELVKIK
jgi:unsaturated rhamnogalacturonyl hydrolase